MQAAKNLIETLQEQIKTRMEDKKLTARDLERDSGLKMSAVRNVLNGYSKNPGIELIAAIAKLLDCSTDELLGVESRKSKSATNKQKIIDVWNFDLYENCLKEVQSYLHSKSLKPQAEQILFFIREAYIYSIEGKGSKADLRFIKWLIDSHC